MTVLDGSGAVLRTACVSWDSVPGTSRELDLTAPAASFLRELHVSFPSVAFSGDPGKELGVEGYPSVLAIDASGKVVAVAV